MSIIDAVVGNFSKLDPAALRARATGRSYWAVRYANGDIRAEWANDWMKIPREGKQEIRLYCPNGQGATLEKTRNAGLGAIFHIGAVKAQVSIAAGIGGRRQMANIIGIAHDDEGNCTIWAWEPVPGRLVGPIRDNVANMRYGNIGELSEYIFGPPGD